MRFRLSPLLFLAVLPACSGGTDARPPVPARLDIVSGSNQDGVYGQALSQPLVVRVSDASGKSVPNATVLWTASNGTLSPTTSVTDTSGRASTIWTLGQNAVDQAVAAAVSGVAPVIFAAKGRPPVPAVIHSCETN
ncbi:MAG TPA: Ig-like domain-containing protein, partial [Longimicrobiaceae bacterium]